MDGCVFFSRGLIPSVERFIIQSVLYVFTIVQQKCKREIVTPFYVHATAPYQIRDTGPRI